MKSVQVIASVLALNAIAMYLFQNAFSGVDAGATSGVSSVAFGWLAVALAFGLLAGLARGWRNACFRISKAALPFGCFVGYFLMKLVVDNVSQSELTGDTIGTTGGILFGYGLGTVGAFGIQGLTAVGGPRRMLQTVGTLCLFSVVVTCAAMTAVGYAHLSGHLQVAHLLVTDKNGYQRAGNFLSMVFLLLSLTVISLVYMNKRSGKLQNKVLTLVGVATYIVMAPLLMYEAQLLGSNSTVAFVVATAVPTIAFCYFGLCGRHSRDKRVTLLRILWAGLIVGCVVGVLVWTLVGAFGVNVDSLRITNFGQGSMVPDSITARLAILNNDYLQQLSYSPIFGNVTVDSLTTGAGTYAHSLPLSLMSHLGMVGFFLFIFFLCARMKSLYNSSSWCGVVLGVRARQRNFQLCLFLVLLAVVLLASFTVFFTWMPLWFALGLLAPLVTFGASGRSGAAVFSGVPVYW